MFEENVAPAESRRRASLWGVILGLMLFAGPLAAQQQSVQVRAFRFWRPTDLTLTETFTTIPLAILSFERNQDGSQSLAVVDRRVEVLDHNGLAVFNETVRDTIRIAGMNDASMTRSQVSHHHAFQLKPGDYRVRFEVTDVRTGTKSTAETPIAAFRQMPRSSDLVLAGDMLAITADKTPPAGAIVRGKVGILPNFTGALTPDKARLALYTEVYRMNMPQDSAQVQIQVTGANSFRYRTPSQPRIYPSGIGSEAFALDLTGLPPGNYTLQMLIAGARDTITLEHPLGMLPPGSGQVQAPTAKLFENLNEAQLDSVFGPIRYLATPSEVDSYQNLANAEGKRRWLTEFWQRTAAASGESVEQMLQDWEDRLRFVNRDFQPTRRGQGNRAGWQTDRGRIYMKFGQPKERSVSNQNRGGDIKGCEIWQYTSGRGDRYVFLDRTGFGDFDLAYSTDRNEPGIPEYEATLKNARTCDNQ